MHPKDFYRGYLADNNTSLLSKKLKELITSESPVHVLEYGCGTGKNLRGLDCVTAGLDLSFVNVCHAIIKNDIKMAIYGDETHLRNLCNFDVVFTCSVLDHIEDIGGIIGEFKRIANKSVFLAETNSFEGNYYYKHDYESYGFTKLNFEWMSNNDGATYHIWQWNKELCVESPAQ